MVFSPTEIQLREKLLVFELSQDNSSIVQRGCTLWNQRDALLCIYQSEDGVNLAESLYVIRLDSPASKYLLDDLVEIPSLYRIESDKRLTCEIPESRHTSCSELVAARYGQKHRLLCDQGYFQILWIMSDTQQT